MTLREKAVDKLRKLLAHQKSAAQIGNQAEAETFAEKIQELLTTHQLELAEIEASSAEDMDVIKIQAYADGIPRTKCEKWSSALLNVVARGNYCRVVHLYSNLHEIVGHAQDIQVVWEMHQFLYNACIAVCDKEFDNYYGTEAWNQFLASTHVTPTWGSRIWRDSYKLGFVSGVKTRIEERKRHVLAYGSEHALVYLNKKLERVERGLERFYPRLRKGQRSNSMINADAYGKGREHGKTTGLSDRKQLL